MLLLACLIYVIISVEALQNQNHSRSEKQLSVFTGHESVKKIKDNISYLKNQISYTFHCQMSS